MMIDLDKAKILYLSSLDSFKVDNNLELEYSILSDLDSAASQYLMTGLITSRFEIYCRSLDLDRREAAYKIHSRLDDLRFLKLSMYLKIQKYKDYVNRANSIEELPKSMFEDLGLFPIELEPSSIVN